MFKRCTLLLVVFFGLCCANAAPVRAGTTGTIVGRVVDIVSGSPIAGVTVTIASPSQSASALTDASGAYRFLSVPPDSYQVSASQQGYDAYSQAGVGVFADQTHVVDIRIRKTLREIGRVTSASSGALIKPGTTSDVYSISGAKTEATAALSGPGNLNNAYGSIASVPGANVPQGQQGWFQQLSIRGGDPYDQVGYELDGIPVNRVYDNSPQTFLSSLGQQELQVYTGGTPASSDGQGIAGYVNQVIKTGTYPGFITLNAGLASPAYYHKLSFEAGGSTPNRLFSYYVGISGANQDFRYADQSNGVGDPQLFYPIAFPFGLNGSRFNIYDGTPGTGGTIGNGIFLAPGPMYAFANLAQRDTVGNFHVRIPHKRDTGRDDLQLLYLNSRIFGAYNSSINDQGGAAVVGPAVGTNGQSFYHDGYTYTGPLFAPPDPTKITPFLFYSSPTNRTFNSALPNSARDTNDNNVAITKLQYQRNINQRSFLRFFGYSLFSDWLIGGQANQQFTCCFGAELNDYQIFSHTYGANLSYSNQLSDKHLVTATGAYSTTELQRRYYYGFPGNQGNGTAFTNLIDTKTAAQTGNCFDPASGSFTSCFGGARGTFVIPNAGGPASPSSGTLPITATTFPNGAAPQWTVTENGPLGRLNNVSPIFSAASLTDQWRPNDRLTLNLGLRIENYLDRFADTRGGPNRAFWVKAYNNETCYKPGVFGVINIAALATPDANGVFATQANCTALAGPGYLPANFVNDNGDRKLSATLIQPRVAFTYSLNPDSVVRGAFGLYSRPVNTQYLQFNNLNDRDFLGYAASNFLGYGFNTPSHRLRPDVSYNYDLSFEHRVKGTDISYKITPFYRSTRDQLQAFPIGVGGITSGFNVGRQKSTGVEVAVEKGDFSRDGFSAALTYTYTHSRIRYAKLPSGVNVIDGLNLFIQEYNSYTSACSTITSANSANCGLAPGAANPNAAPTFTTNGKTVTNPYFGRSAQALLNPNGEYTTYDQIPQPFVGQNGYETPHIASLILSYKRSKLSVTPSFTYSSGASYGSPLSYPGYIPSGGCSASPGTTNAIPYTCGGSSIANPSLPFIMTPDQFTGHFDNLGEFKQPARLTMNMTIGYELSKRIRTSLVLNSLVDKCYQRGYPWDNPHICSYAQLPSGGAGLGPSGNFIPVGQTPVPFRYPYGVYNNNLNTGFLGVTLPFQATLNFEIKM